MLPKIFLHIRQIGQSFQYTLFNYVKFMLKELIKPTEIFSHRILGPMLLIINQKKFYGNLGNVISFHSFATSMTEMKERILNCSYELFMSYGVRSVSMDDIAKRLSISKKTIYQFYKDKNELVDELMNKKLKQDEQDIGQ